MEKKVAHMEAFGKKAAQRTLTSVQSTFWKKRNLCQKGLNFEQDSLQNVLCSCMVDGLGKAPQKYRFWGPKKVEKC